MITIKVYDADKLNTYKDFKRLRGWVYGFVREKSGKIILAEITNLGLERLHNGKVEHPIGYCNVSTDIISEKVFNKVAKDDPDFYGKKSWAEYRSDIFLDLLRRGK